MVPLAPNAGRRLSCRPCFMKWCYRILLAVLLVRPAYAVETNIAALHGWCRSLSLNGADAILQNGPATAAFSTFDGQPSTLLRDQIGNVAFVSNEVRPRAGSPGLYETDYGFFRSFGFVEFGSLV